MQPEISPPDNQSITTSHYIALAPTLLAFIAVFTSATTWFAEVGGGTLFANQLAFIFCALMLLATSFSLVDYLRQGTSSKRLRVLALWNAFLLALSTFSCFYLITYSF